MLLDEEEVRIMSAAKQEALRSPTYSGSYYARIFNDFFRDFEWRGQRVFEIGPGQYDFAMLLRGAGADVSAIDNDPAVVALGEKRGFRVIHSDINAYDWAKLRAQFTGVFCRGSINAFSCKGDQEMCRVIAGICGLVGPSGWGWISPYNKAPGGTSPADVAARLRTQKNAFTEGGFFAVDVDSSVAPKYKISVMDNCVVFLKNVDVAPLAGRA